jgi:hypothetical protein
VRGVLALAVALSALVAGGVSAATVPKVTLTVAVTGHGTVTSTPAGINCKPKCTLHVRKGAKVVLTASPADGAEFSHWSAPCGTSFRCTVKMTGAKTAHAFFTAQPATPPPPPPPPSTTPKPGHYAGTYTDGSFFEFDVQGLAVTGVGFDFNGSCSDGGTQAAPAVSVNGTFPVASDGSFGGPITLTFSNAGGTANLAGTVTPSGTANGTLNISVTFNDGTVCTSKGTWTAQDQS